MKVKRINLLLLAIFCYPLLAEAKPGDLVTPVMTEETPDPGKRVRQVAPEYKGTQVYHTLYLPTDWQKGKTYPVLVEYTGNKAPFCAKPCSHETPVDQNAFPEC